ncbi:MAG: hypothetical protein BWX87_02384 [Bacteroidetes bacterium ADurb.Bin123]|jgi:hypothetical protein|nr:MAG: hypothetical protein BWX87_02384 [Bacteroidetes bacterium ADurb.Bin123]
MFYNIFLLFNNKLKNSKVLKICPDSDLGGIGPGN